MPAGKPARPRPSSSFSSSKVCGARVRGRRTRDEEDSFGIKFRCRLAGSGDAAEDASTARKFRQVPRQRRGRLSFWQTGNRVCGTGRIGDRGLTRTGVVSLDQQGPAQEHHYAQGQRNPYSAFGIQFSSSPYCSPGHMSRARRAFVEGLVRPPWNRVHPARMKRLAAQ